MQDFLKKAILRLFPELSGGLHLDRYGRVLAIADAPSQGASSERFRPRFAADIEILTADMEPDPAFPHYTAVPLPVPLGQAARLAFLRRQGPGRLWLWASLTVDRITPLSGKCTAWAIRCRR